MSSSAALSVAATSRSGVTRPALSQLTSSHATQSRKICRTARNTQLGSQDTPEQSRPLGRSYRTRSSFSDLPGGGKRSFFESEREQMLQRMTSLKSHLPNHPFGAIFSHKVDFLKRIDKLHHARPGSLWSYINTEQPTPKSHVPLKAHLQDFNFAHSPENPDITRDGSKYDPISGRMIPEPPQPSVDCTPGGEIEANLVHDPICVDIDQFLPGSAPDNILPEAPLTPHVIDCPPGSEVNALFMSIPSSCQDVLNEAGAFKEASQSPNINIGCPPGNELEALYISESALTGQPQAESSKPSRHMKKLSVNAGVRSGGNFECSPGCELEAMFSSNPILGVAQISPLDSHRMDPPGTSKTSVDCPPGIDLDAKLASLSSDGVAGAKSEATIVCPPGSELEAKFIAEPASTTEDGQFQPFLVADDIHTQQASIALQCQPGNKPEAMFVSQLPDRNLALAEDLSSLQARDIRARYASVDADIEPKSYLSKDIEDSGAEDRVGDYIQKANTNITPHAQQSSAAIYRILIYDTSLSQVTTAESDLFFGVKESTPLAEVLSRLQNPAKFVPYFEEMQHDGYEIATGGGNILVFRKVDDLTPSNAIDQGPPHTDISKSLRHDSYQTETPSSSSKPTITNQPPPASGSNGVKESTSFHSESTASKVFRRTIFTGTATAASFYAIGVVVEYFRTGGQDGYGIDGFTVFESERRHRD
ncbi:hypothetical protein N7454_006554 [Penicillium verhagenii]|nr:hypothetical protein N7454_006554 [Penicillium verhagenii]